MAILIYFEGLFPVTTYFTSGFSWHPKAVHRINLAFDNAHSDDLCIFS
jgi:hypothetical protein